MPVTTAPVSPRLRDAWEQNFQATLAACTERMQLKEMKELALSEAKRREELVEQRIAKEECKRAEQREAYVRKCDAEVSNLEMQESLCKQDILWAERRSKALDQCEMLLGMIQEAPEPSRFSQLAEDSEVQDALQKFAVLEFESIGETDNEANDAIATAKAELFRAFESADQRIPPPGDIGAEEALRQIEQEEHRLLEASQLKIRQMEHESKQRREKVEALAVEEMRALDREAEELEASEESRSRFFQQAHQNKLQELNARVLAAQRQEAANQEDAYEAKRLIMTSMHQTLAEITKQHQKTEHAAHEELQQMREEGKRQLSSLEAQIAHEQRAQVNANEAKEQLLAEHMQQLQTNEDLIAELEAEEAAERAYICESNKQEELAVQRIVEAEDRAASQIKQDSLICEDEISKIKTDSLEAVRELTKVKSTIYSEAEALNQRAFDEQGAFHSMLDRATLAAKEQELTDLKALASETELAEERISAEEAHAAALKNEGESEAASLIMEAHKKKEEIALIAHNIQRKAEEAVASRRVRELEKINLERRKALICSTTATESIESMRLSERTDIERYSLRCEEAKQCIDAARIFKRETCKRIEANLEAKIQFVEEKMSLRHHEVQEISEKIKVVEQEAAAASRRKEGKTEEAKHREEAAESELRNLLEDCEMQSSVIAQSCRDREQAAAHSVFTAIAEAREEKEKEEEGVLDAQCKKKAEIKALQEAGEEGEQQFFSAMATSMKNDGDWVKKVRAEESERKQAFQQLHAKLEEIQRNEEQEAAAVSYNERLCEELNHETQELQEETASEELACKEEIAYKEQEKLELLERRYTEHEEEVAAWNAISAESRATTALYDERIEAARQQRAACLMIASEVMESIRQDKAYQEERLQERAHLAESAVRKFLQDFEYAQKAAQLYVSQEISESTSAREEKSEQSSE